jgi:hypothetical protein
MNKFKTFPEISKNSKIKKTSKKSLKLFKNSSTTPILKQAFFKKKN